MLEQLIDMEAKKTSWIRRYHKHHDEVIEYEMELQKKFALHNTVIFLVYAGFVWLMELFLQKDGGKGQWFCLGLGVYTFVNYLLQRFVLPKHRKHAVWVVNLYILLLEKALLSTNVVCNEKVSWTLLLCTFIMTSMLCVMPVHYGVILGIVVMMDMIEFAIKYQAVLPVIYNLVDDIIIATVCMAVNVLFSKKKYQEFERREALLTESSRDGLTQLYNRRHLERYYARTVKKETMCALVMLDLDNFKAANDLYGHKMGDRVLCEVSDILRQNFRETDCIARLGGDEFAVFLPELPDKQLVVQRVQSVLKQFPIVLDGETRTEISVSVGIACKNGGEDMSYEQLCDKADIVMYSAKNSGKARAVLAPDTFGKELIVTAEEQEYRNRFRIAQ